ncbi:hypothetical protein [Pseudofulvibacter geojedonensis]|uniref:Cytochrome c domain-containing protein n=1 Tax=Pseudofulvibacter geojedonensis TaxID=1123758 RepID=A0ABW3HZV6_9FLAO
MKSFLNSSLFFAVVLALLITSCKDKEHHHNNEVYSEIPSPVTFSPNIPVDVDPLLQEKLKKEKNIYKLNEAFNEYSWQALVAINWPRDEQGNAMPNFTDKGEATWLGWKEAFQVYRKDGLAPSSWGSPRTASGLGISKEILSATDARLLLLSTTPTAKRDQNIADEVDQAFAGKLFDQNGNVVVYEVLMNKEEYDYIVDKKLYNINGQLAYTKKNPEADFPAGNYENNELGAIEIKFAWKILEDTDYKERYFTDEGYIVDEETNELVKKDLGMIGFHISQKTPTGKQWVWSTFEHVDNLRENQIEKDGKTVRIPPSLRNAECEICPANVDVTHNSRYEFKTDKHGNFWEVTTRGAQIEGTSPPKYKDSTKARYYANSNVMKTQAHRMVNIPSRVQRINERMQTYFRQQNSVWQYYELIDTQYPLNQNVPSPPHDDDNYVLPTSVTDKSGGDTNIALLTNITMETFFQKGNQSASNLMENNPTSDITIYGTESCIGCHSSAGIYNSYTNGKLGSGEQLSGDFSWLLGRAQWDSSKPKPTE